MANPPPPPSEPSVPELPEALLSEPELPEAPEEEARDSTPPPAPIPRRVLSAADEKLRAKSCAAIMDPKVTRVMVAIVRDMGVRGSQVVDIVDQIRNEIWEAFDLRADWPQDTGRWVAILREATKYKLIDIFRTHTLREPISHKVGDAKLEQVAIPPSSHRDQDDVREKAGLIGQVKLTEKAAAVLDARMAGKSVSAAAKEHGMTSSQGHELLRSVQREFRRAYEHRYGRAALKAAALGGGAWLFVLWVDSHFDPYLWYGGSSAAATTVSAADAPAIRQDATRLAADAIAKADAACDAGEWGDCQKALALASTYDQDGNFAFQISKLGELADQGLIYEDNLANAKPGGSLPKPPKLHRDR